VKSNAQNSVKEVQIKQRAYSSTERQRNISYILTHLRLFAEAITDEEGRRDVEREEDGDHGCDEGTGLDVCF
jgi:hypothetical protein